MGRIVLGFESQSQQDIFLSARLDLGPTQVAIQWVLSFSFPFFLGFEAAEE
jgi:hypothetical protein